MSAQDAPGSMFDYNSDEFEYSDADDSDYQPSEDYEMDMGSNRSAEELEQLLEMANIEVNQEIDDDIPPLITQEEWNEQEIKRKARRIAIAGAAIEGAGAEAHVAVSEADVDEAGTDADVTDADVTEADVTEADDTGAEDESKSVGAEDDMKHIYDTWDNEDQNKENLPPIDDESLRMDIIYYDSRYETINQVNDKYEPEPTDPPTNLSSNLIDIMMTKDASKAFLHVPHPTDPTQDQHHAVGSVEELQDYTSNPLGASLPENSFLQGWPLHTNVSILGETRSAMITVLEKPITDVAIDFYISRRFATRFYHVDTDEYIHGQVELQPNIWVEIYLRVIETELFELATVLRRPPRLTVGGTNGVAFMATRSQEHEGSLFLLDSGCSTTYTGQRELLSDFKPKKGTVMVADHSLRPVQGVGYIYVMGKKLEAHLVKGFHNLLSVSQLANHGVKCCFGPKSLTLEVNEHSVELYPQANGLYYISVDEMNEAHYAKPIPPHLTDLHQVYGHPGVSISRILKIKPQVDCLACIRGKTVKKSYKKNDSRAKYPNQVVSVDTCGPIRPPSLGRNYYFEGYVDNFSGNITIFLKKKRSEDNLTAYHALNPDTECFRVDGAKEYTSVKIPGVRMQCRTPHCPEENGIAENALKQVQQLARTLMQASNLPNYIWGEAVSFAAVILNNRPQATSKSKDDTPQMRFNGTSVDLEKLPPFGSIVEYRHGQGSKLPKFASRTGTGVFVGTASNTSVPQMISYPSPAIRIFVNNQVIIAHLVRTIAIPKLTPPSLQFREGNWEGFKAESESDDDEEEELKTDDENSVAPSDHDEDSDSDDEEEVQATVERRVRFNLPDEAAQPPAEHIQPPGDLNENVDEEVELKEERPRRQSARASYGPGFYANPAFMEQANTAILSDPTTRNEALKAHDADCWLEAEEKEFEQLFKNHVFELVKRSDLPTGVMPIPSKMVYKRKTDGQGRYVKHKARYTACGNFIQRQDSTFKVFSPTIAYEVLLFVLALISLLSLWFESWDVSGAYLLSDHIGEDVYLHCPNFLPTRFLPNSGKHSDYVLKIKKSLYGLDSSAKAWFQHADKTLRSLGYTCFLPCFYFKLKPFSLICVHVDDFQCGFVSKQVAEEERAKVLKKLPITFDHSNEQTVLGVLLKFSEKGLAITAPNLVTKLLQKFKFENSNIKFTPFASNFRDIVSKAQDSIEMSLTVAGSAMYSGRLCRPDILPAACNLLRFPSTVFAKQLLRYVAGTVNQGVFYPKGHIDNYPLLFGMSDAEFASDPDRRSTYGSQFNLTNTEVSYIGPRLITLAKKLNVISDSISEAETLSLYETAKLAIFYRQLLADLGYPQTWPTPIFTDSRSTLDLLANRKIGRSKHWDVRLRKLHEYLDSEQLTFLHIPSKWNCADFNCNPVKLSKEHFEELRFCITNSSAREGLVMESQRRYQQEVWNYLKEKIGKVLQEHRSNARCQQAGGKESKDQSCYDRSH
jgi:hypothetical protein